MAGFALEAAIRAQTFRAGGWAGGGDPRPGVMIPGAAFWKRSEDENADSGAETAE